MSAPAIYTTTSGPLGTQTPVELEHIVDTTPNDRYECVTVHIDGRMVDLGVDDAETLGAKLLMFVGQARAMSGVL